MGGELTPPIAEDLLAQGSSIAEGIRLLSHHQPIAGITRFLSIVQFGRILDRAVGHSILGKCREMPWAT